MGMKWTNNAISTVASPPSGTTGLSFSLVDGSKFPVLGAGDYAVLTRDDGSGNIECVRVSARSGNAFTVATGGRGFDGTTAYTWSPGDLVELRVTRAMIDNCVSKDNADTKTADLAFAGAVLAEDLSSSLTAASTTDLNTATGNVVPLSHSSGTVNIASFGGATTIAAGTGFEVLATVSGGTLNLVHSSALSLPGDANITVGNGDSFHVRKMADGTDQWLVTSYRRRSGNPPSTGASGAAVLAAANQTSARSAIGVAAAEVHSFLAGADVAAARAAISVASLLETIGNANVRNWVRNPEFRHWQRTTLRNSSQIITPYRGFSADCWQANRAGDVGGLLVFRGDPAISPPGFESCFVMRRAPTTSGTQTCSLYHTATRQAGRALSGVPVAFSFWARAGANYSGGSLTAALLSTPSFITAEVPVYDFVTPASPVSATPTLTTSWQRFTYGATMPTAEQFGMSFSWTPSGTAGADDSVYIGGVQVTPFNGASHALLPLLRRTHQDELAQILPFFEKSYEVDINPGTATAIGQKALVAWNAGGTPGQSIGDVPFRANKFKAPTITLYSVAGTSGQVTANGADSAYLAPGDINTGNFQMVTQSAWAANVTGFHFTADAEI